MPTPSMEAAMLKNRESRLRRKALRMGYVLRRIRRRDPDALDHGLYAVIDVDNGFAANPSNVIGTHYSWDLDDVEDFLTGEDE